MNKYYENDFTISFYKIFIFLRLLGFIYLVFLHIILIPFLNYKASMS